MVNEVFCSSLLTEGLDIVLAAANVQIKVGTICIRTLDNDLTDHPACSTPSTASVAAGIGRIMGDSVQAFSVSDIPRAVSEGSIDASVPGELVPVAIGIVVGGKPLIQLAGGFRTERSSGPQPSEVSGVCRSPLELQEKCVII